MIPFRRLVAEKRRWLGALAALAFANLAIWLLGVLPLRARVTSTVERAAAAERDVVAASAQLDQARRTVEGRVRANENLRRFYGEVLPPDLTVARRVTHLRLAQLARESNLSVSRRSFTIETDDDTALSRLDTTMELGGDYGDIRDYVYAVETAPEFFVIRSLALRPDSNEGSKLRFGMSVSTYFRTVASDRR